MFFLRADRNYLGSSHSCTCRFGFPGWIHSDSWRENLTLEQFAWTYNTENVTMLPAIINTVTMTVLSLLLAAPLGIFSAIYLVEYANKRGTLVGLIRITAETLSGIPSIVYGLFGMLFLRKP